MSSVVISGDTSGAVTVAVPAVAGTNTVTIAAQTGTLNAAGPTFSAYQSSSQTLTAATVAKLQFQTEEWDTANCFDSSTNYRFTPNVAGYYQVSASFAVLSTATNCYIAIYKNGSEYKRGMNVQASSALQSMSCLIYFNGSTDYVEAWGYSGVTQGVSTGSNFTYFQAALVRGA